MKHPIYIELFFESGLIKTAITETGSIYLCARDIAVALKRPSFLVHNPIFALAPQSKKINFNTKKALWGIVPSEVAQYFKSVSNESTISRNRYEKLVKWAESLTIDAIMSSRKETATSEDTEIIDEIEEAEVIEEATFNATGKLIQFDYIGTPVSFHMGDDVMIYATGMGQSFNKRVKDWMRLKSTVEYIHALAQERGVSTSALYKKVRGGANGEQGTWLHRSLAIEFARWLNPRFGVWCNERLQELLRFGVTTTPLFMEEALKDPQWAISLLQGLQHEREEKELAMKQRDEAMLTVEAAKPKVAYYDEVVESRDFYTTSQLASELGMSYCKLRNKLKKLGIIISETGTTIATPYTPWGECVKLSKHDRMSWKWNKEGRYHIFNLINPEMPR